MTTPNGFHADSTRSPNGLQMPRARAHSTATYTATSTWTRCSPIHDLSLSARETSRPVDNPQPATFPDLMDGSLRSHFGGGR